MSESIEGSVSTPEQRESFGEGLVQSPKSKVQSPKSKVESDLNRR